MVMIVQLPQERVQVFPLAPQEPARWPMQRTNREPLGRKLISLGLAELLVTHVEEAQHEETLERQRVQRQPKAVHHHLRQEKVRVAPVRRVQVLLGEVLTRQRVQRQPKAVRHSLRQERVRAVQVRRVLVLLKEDPRKQQQGVPRNQRLPKRQALALQSQGVRDKRVPLPLELRRAAQKQKEARGLVVHGLRAPQGHPRRNLLRAGQVAVNQEVRAKLAVEISDN